VAIDMLLQKKKQLLISIIFLSVLASFYYFLSTEHAAGLFIRYFLGKKIVAEEINIERIKGTILTGVILENIEIRNSKIMILPHFLRAQSIKIQFYFSIFPVSVIIENARLFLDKEDPIVFSGTYKKDQWDIDLFSRGLGLTSLFKSLSVSGAFFERTTGYLKDIQLHLTGTRKNPRLEGFFVIDKILTRNFSIRCLPIQLHLIIRDIGPEFKIEGEITSSEGNLFFRNSQVNIVNSRIVYQDNPQNPALFINGESFIDKTKIKISVRGFLHDPHIELTSYPPLSQERLLVMLATNKSWKSLERSLGAVRQNEISSDMVKDFFDYAFLGGSGEKMAQTLGIKDGWVRFTQNTRTMGIKKSLSDELDVGYQIEEIKNVDRTKDVKYKVLGDVQVTDSISVSVEKELKKNQAQQDQIQKNPSDDKFLIKYEKRF